MTIDLKKLARLRGQLAVDSAALQGLRENARRKTDNAQPIRAHVYATLRMHNSAAAQWNERDGIEALLALPADVLASMRVDVPSAEAAAELLAEARALNDRATALQPQVDALRQLVGRCDKYVKEHHRG